MEKWPLGVFTSIDAGFGVKLETAHELGLTTIAPRSWLNSDFNERAAELSPAARAGQNDSLEKTDRLMELEREAVTFQTGMRALGIALTAVFGGFEGESYADIQTVVRSVGLTE